MAKAKEDAPKGNRPAFNVRARQGPSADGTPSEFFTTVGAVWPFKEGEGFVMKLDFIPVNGDGSFLLVAPKDNE